MQRLGAGKIALWCFQLSHVMGFVVGKKIDLLESSGMRKAVIAASSRIAAVEDG